MNPTAKYQPGLSPSEAETLEMQKHQIEELKMAVAMKQNLAGAPGRNGSKSVDRYHLPQMIMGVTEEANILIKEIHELRERLSPILSDMDGSNELGRGTPPAASEMSGNIANIYQTIIASRQAIQAIIAQLDL
jgi:hypothetical protein